MDKAESEAELALAVNGGAPWAFAEALADTGGRLLQVSTDFVFNGQQGSPYRPEQAVAVGQLTTAEYPLPAQRPSYSLLDCSSSRRELGLAPTLWRQALRQLLQALP